MYKLSLFVICFLFNAGQIFAEINTSKINVLSVLEEITNSGDKLLTNKQVKDFFIYANKYSSEFCYIGNGAAGYGFVKGKLDINKKIYDYHISYNGIGKLYNINNKQEQYCFLCESEKCGLMYFDPLIDEEKNHDNIIYLRDSYFRNMWLFLKSNYLVVDKSVKWTKQQCVTNTNNFLIDIKKLFNDCLMYALEINNAEDFSSLYTKIDCIKSKIEQYKFKNDIEKTMYLSLLDISFILLGGEIKLNNDYSYFKENDVYVILRIDLLYFYALILSNSNKYTLMEISDRIEQTLISNKDKMKKDYNNKKISINFYEVYNNFYKELYSHSLLVN